MKDNLNPTPGEIKKWAYQKTKKEPMIDWDVVISTIGNADQLLSFASDPECPKKHYFLKCLYLLVGNSVSKHRAKDSGKVESLLEKAESSSDPLIINWVARSRTILHDLRKFDYTEWCEGGLANKDIGVPS